MYDMYSQHDRMHVLRCAARLRPGIARTALWRLAWFSQVSRQVTRALPAL